MWFDTHLHTTFSSDSTMTYEQALNQAKAQEMGLVLTEHMDLGYPVPGEFVFSVDQYFSTYGPYRSESLLLGIEIGMRLDYLAENRRIVENNDFDMVIGSIHVVDGHDLYYPDYYEGKDKLESYAGYLKAMAECVKQYDFIDTLGHVDYICRYAPYLTKDLLYHEFSDLLDSVLQSVADQGMALELNTRRLGDRAVREVLLPIYCRFAELGGKWVTLGSDAHKPEQVGLYLAEARQLAQAAGLTPVVYKQRQRRVLDFK